MRARVVSVVVPVRNGERHLPALLRALDAQTLDTAAFELIVVDDDSSDATARIVGDWMAGTRVASRLLPGAGRGPAAARNVGIGASRAPWVAFTDADTRPRPDWLEQGLRAADGAAAPIVEGAVVATGRDVAGPFAHVVANRDGGRYMTANMLYRRDVLAALGGFDDHFGDAFLEDSDLAFRALERGHRIAFAPAAVVEHPVLAVTATALLRSARKTRWIALLARRHPQRYRELLRPVVRPLGDVDQAVVAGWLAAAGALAARRKTTHAALGLVIARGLWNGLAPRQGGPLAVLGRVVPGLLLPPLRAFWWLEGAARFRRLPR